MLVKQECLANKHIDSNLTSVLFAVSENAAEACATKCSPADQSLLSVDEARDVKTKQEYDACYSKCVAQETKEVVEEREKVILGHCCTLMPSQARDTYAARHHFTDSSRDHHAWSWEGRPWCSEEHDEQSISRVHLQFYVQPSSCTGAMCCQAAPLHDRTFCSHSLYSVPQQR